MRLLLPAIACFSAGCVAVQQPGHFEPTRAAVPPSSSLRAELVKFAWAGGAVAEGAEVNDAGVPSPQVAERVREAMRLQLEREGPFALTGRDVLLEGEIRRIHQPGEPDASEGSSGSSSGGGEGVLILGVLLAAYGVAVLFGAPTDCRDADVDLILRARDGAHRQIIAEWNATADHTSCAGIYYKGWPLKVALEEAANELIDSARQEAPLLEKRLAAWSIWYRSYGLERLDSPLGAVAVAIVARALGDSDPGVRVRAAFALREGMAAKNLAREALLRALEDRDAAVRATAIDTLLALGERDPTVLAQLAARDRDPEVREAARAAAVRIRLEIAAERAPSALAPAIRGLGATAVEERLRSLEQIAGAGVVAEPATPALIVAAHDPSLEVRLAALRAMPRIEARSEEVDALLEDLLDDPSTELRVAAEEVIRQLSFQKLARGGDREPPPVVAEPAPVERSDAPIVAVFDLQDAAGKLASKKREQLTDYLSARLTASGEFRIVPSSELRARLMLQKKESLRACYDEACQIELGREVAAGKALSTKLLRIGNRCTLTATLFDLRTEVAERAATQDCSGRVLSDVIDLLVEDLIRSRIAPR